MQVEDLTAHAQLFLPCPGEALGYAPWLESLDPGSCARGTPCYAFSHGDPSALHIPCKAYFSVRNVFLNYLADVPYFSNRSFKTNLTVQQDVGTAFQVHAKQTAADPDRSKSEIKETLPRLNGEVLHSVYVI